MESVFGRCVADDAAAVAQRSGERYFLAWGESLPRPDAIVRLAHCEYDDTVSEYVRKGLQLANQDARAGCVAADLCTGPGSRGTLPALVENRQRSRAARLFQRFGFAVQFQRELGCPLRIWFPGHSPTARARQHRLHLIATRSTGLPTPDIVLYPRSFRQVRQRGVLRSVPPLLAWLRAARIRIADPSRKATQARLRREYEAAAAEPLDGARERERAAAAKVARLAAWKASRFASPEEIDDGACWAGVRHAGTEHLVRLETVVDRVLIGQALVAAVGPWDCVTFAARDDDLEVLWLRDGPLRDHGHCAGRGCEGLYLSRFRTADDPEMRDVMTDESDAE